MSLDGKTSLVTGATNGHGRAVALELARLGSEIIIVGRDERKCALVQKEIEAETGKPAGYLVCDLSSRKDIQRTANQFLASGKPLHVLVNNAGIVNRTRRESVDGVEETFAVNYLAYYQLTLLLLERMRQSTPARIVNVASDAHRVVSLDLDDLDHRKSYSWWSAYGRSKLAIVYFTHELARRLQGSGVTVNAVDPGPVASNIAMNNSGKVVTLAGWMIRYLFPRPGKAARTAVYLASSPEVSGINGGYFKYGKQRAPRIDLMDPCVGARLWQTSAGMTGVDFSS